MGIRLIYFSCVVLATGILALAGYSLPKTDSDPVSLQRGARTKQLPLQIQEFSYASQDQNRIVQVLQAQQIVIQPRRFLVFNIKSVNEAVLHNAHFETHFYENTAAQPLLLDFQEALPLDKGTRNKHHAGSGVGLVTRAIAKGVVRFDIFRDKVRSIALVAEYGLMEKKKPEAEFINAILRNSGSDRLIRSSRILWNEKRKVFVIPGAYVMSASGKNTNGESIEIDLDFNITPAVS